MTVEEEVGRLGGTATLDRRTLSADRTLELTTFDFGRDRDVSDGVWWTERMGRVLVTVWIKDREEGDETGTPVRCSRWSTVVPGRDWGQGGSGVRTDDIIRDM